MVDEKALTNILLNAIDDGEPLRNELMTNQRVIARVTDGIYRQPGSAIRELIANAYDADASWVNVNTNAPKFDQIIVEDDGNGMSPEAVVYMLSNIGGSAKRAIRGKDLRVTDEHDPTKSPGGRKLIGKLGIGMFSVSQLTRSFQLITKTKGEKYRTVVLVNLHQFSDAAVYSDDESSKAGSYVAWREHAEDLDAHGTTIVLTSIRKQTKEMLASDDLWNAFDVDDDGQEGIQLHVNVPQYYIGRVDGDDAYKAYTSQGSEICERRLPWDETDTADTAFEKLVDAVWEGGKANSKVKLDSFFDNYLQMVWNLSLALPLPYIDKNPFRESVSDEWAYYYKLSNSSRGSAQRLEVPKDSDESMQVSDLSGIEPPSESVGDFTVTLDGVRLYRPLRFRNLPMTQNAVKRPLLFVGEYRQEFKNVDDFYSGGPLAFKAYLMWAPRIVPTEHQGCLVRIHGASGTLFDSTFFNYQVAEITRRSQVTCEIFIEEGLEGALNIDRESFNTSHPHTVVLAAWVHSAFRQLSNAQKALGQQLRLQTRAESDQKAVDAMASIVTGANEFMTEGEGEIPVIRLQREGESLGALANEPMRSYEMRSSSDKPEPSKRSVEKAQSIMQVLFVYGLLDGLSDHEQERLANDILSILEVDHE